MSYLDEMLAVLPKLTPIERMSVVTHPNNRGFLQRLLPETGQFETLGSVTGIDVIFDEAVEERDIEERWYPPPAEKFVEYGPEDEHWMRPLGLGRIERIDRGPKFVSMKIPVPVVDLEVPDFDYDAMSKMAMRYLVEEFSRPILEPPLLILGTTA